MNKKIGIKFRLPIELVESLGANGVEELKEFMTLKAPRKAEDFAKWFNKFMKLSIDKKVAMIKESKRLIH
jgi:hypothetical protein